MEDKNHFPLTLSRKKELSFFCEHLSLFIFLSWFKANAEKALAIFLGEVLRHLPFFFFVVNSLR